MEELIYDVSVIMACYNPDFNKMIKTINSVISQRGVTFQLVVCDDGSKNSYFSEVEKYLLGRQFKDYKLISSEKNNGTVINFHNGLHAADGEYIKGISPGDYLYEKDELSKWIQFMRENKVGLSFGHAVFYHNEDGIPKLMKRHRDAPAIPEIYDPKHNAILYKELQKIDWMVCRDSILGCLILSKKELCIRYMSEIVNKVKYAEDYSFRLMLLDGIKLAHYNRPVLYYEYGEGVSNSSREKWEKYLYNDEVAFAGILEEKKNNNTFIRQYCRLLKIGTLDFYGIRRQFFSVLLFPLSLPWKVYKMVYRKMGRSRPFEEGGEIIIRIQEL